MSAEITPAANMLPSLSPEVSQPVPNAPEQFTNRPTRLERYSAKIGRTLMALALAMQLGGSHPNEYEPEPRIPGQTYDTVELPTLGEPKTCPDPRPEAILFVDKLLSGPENPRREQIKEEYEQRGPKPYTQKTLYELDRERDDAIEALKHETAEKYGLTVHDGRPLMNAITQTMIESQKANRPIGDKYYKHFAEAKEFLSQYGVELRIGTEVDHYEYGGTAPTAKELESQQSLDTLHSLVWYFSDLPVEYVRMINLKHIVAMGGRSTEADAYAYMDDSHDTTYFNVNGTRASEIFNYEPTGLPTATFGHEISGHIADGTLCPNRSAFNDPSFTRLNDGYSYNVGTRPSGVNLENVNEQIIELSNDLVLAQHYRDHTKAKILREKLLQLGEKIHFISNAKSPIEDKADIFSGISLPIYYMKMLEEYAPNLQKKELFLMGRLATYEKGAKIMAFFADMSQRNPRNQMFTSVKQVCDTYKLTTCD